ncbi:hypothetical protein C2I36_10045 [Rhodobacteraceae bacterium WD3A24]|nr:hypothetical protein C2I36_10045 [Rhodobacteraceae bacterium WD3A24]
MLETLKIIHFLSFAVGIGGGVASLLAGLAMRTAGGGAPALAGLQRRLGRASAVAIVLLWITGVWMLYAVYGGWGGMSGWFWIKIVAVVGLTAVSARMQWLSITAQRSGTPPAPRIMAGLGAAANLLAIAAVIIAVIAFTG